MQHECLRSQAYRLDLHVLAHNSRNWMSVVPQFPLVLCGTFWVQGYSISQIADEAMKASKTSLAVRIRNQEVVCHFCKRGMHHVIRHNIVSYFRVAKYDAVITLKKRVMRYISVAIINRGQNMPLLRITEVHKYAVWHNVASISCSCILYEVLLL